MKRSVACPLGVIIRRLAPRISIPHRRHKRTSLVAEKTVSALLDILDDKEVVRAMRLLYPDASPTLVPDDETEEVALAPPLSRDRLEACGRAADKRTQAARRISPFTRGSPRSR
jgi:hypothetical protein